MPKNDGRVGFYSKDGNWYDNIWDRNAADTRYEQQEKIIKGQQESNELLREKINEERRNAEMLAEATKEAEEKRYLHDLELEEQRQEHDKLMRYYNLCDNLNINYDDIQNLELWLNNLTQEQYRWAGLAETNYGDYILTEDIKQIRQKYKSMENELEEQKERLIKNKDIEVKGLERQTKGNKDSINKLIEENTKAISIISALIMFSIFIIIFGIILLLDEVTTLAIVILITTSIFDLAFIDRIFKLKKGKKIMKKAIQKNEQAKKNIENRITNLKKGLNSINNELDRMYEIRYKELEEDKEYQKLNDDYIESFKMLFKGYRPNKREFYNFRINHYNKEMEQLFNKVGIYLEKIEIDEVVSEGSIEDYINYIEDINILDLYIEKSDNIRFNKLINDAIEIFYNEGKISIFSLEKELEINNKMANIIIDFMDEIGLVFWCKINNPNKKKVLKLDCYSMSKEEIEYDKNYLFPLEDLLIKRNNTLGVKEIIETDEFQKSESKLTFALGKIINNEIVIVNAEQIQNLLIIDKTDLNRLKCVNTLITSVLYKAKPSEVKFLMIDLKNDNLSVYKEIPHLLIPIVTDSKKASGSLAWAVQEMNNRYELFDSKNLKDIKEYNSSLKEIERKLPQIVIIIDELKNLIKENEEDIKESINRLLLKANTVGIHLIIATDNESSINNIEQSSLSKILFEDTDNSENMLFYTLNSENPMRMQMAYTLDEEEKNVVDFIITNNKKDDTK